MHNRPGFRLSHVFALAAFILLFRSAAGLGQPPEPPSPKRLPRTTASINVDGDLNDPGWKDALVVDQFYETNPGDNIPAKVKTVAYLTYDESYFYIGILAEDPDPKKIRAPYVERDEVIGTDDNIAVFLDTRNDKRSALELRVNPRGIQGDGIFDDATGNEDFSPDYFYDTAAKITDHGWQAEYRIPLTTLRYPRTDPQSWGILIWRNYPRDFRYAFHSSPMPRGSNCVICHTMELTGISSLPTSHHLVVAPFATGQGVADKNLESPGASFGPTDWTGDAGVDVKWNPTANNAIDATIRPDFSQVESDVPQIAVNQRFALFFPEKRPFFLEGSDLFNSQIQAVYTRTITDPLWGLRGTGSFGGGTNYTVLAGRDEGGGLVVVPGPSFSYFVPQDFKSTVALGRLRQDLGASFASFMFTDREIEGGGHNRVFGPDAQWRPNQTDIVTGQFLYSSTEDPSGVGSPNFQGQGKNDYAGSLWWDHQQLRYDWRLRYNDVGDDFRADLGFVPQAGYREALGAGGLRFYPTGKVLSFVRTYFVADQQYLSNGDDLGHDYYPGVFLQGAHNLAGQFELHDNKVLIANELLTQKYFAYFVQYDPSRRFTRIIFQGRTGDSIDYENVRVGTGTNIGITATVRPFDHLTLTTDLVREWLNLNEPDATGRLYTASIVRLKGVYVFDARSFVRVIGQYVTTTRDPELYTFPVPTRDGRFLASILYGYKLNWQTVFFVGYGDSGLVNESNALIQTQRSFFIKVSYAWQR